MTGSAVADYLPAIYHTNLNNGLTVLGVEYDRAPWLSICFMAKRGAEADPPGKGGTADCTAEGLTLGTTTRDQLRLAIDVESRGARLEAHGNWDYSVVTLEGLAEDFGELMALLAEVVQSPNFPEQDFAFLKGRRQAELVHLQDNPREVANRWYYRLFFGNSPYGHPITGDLESISALTLEDLKSFYQRQFHPSESTLVVVGMVPEATVVHEADRFWSAWSGGARPAPPYQEAPPSLGQPGIYLLDRPALTQSEIRLGHLGLPRQHPDYFALRLANYILGGGGFSSRLMTRIRSDLGLTYGINSHFHFRRAPGPFVISTFTPASNTAAVIQETKVVLAELKQGGITAQELEDAKNFYIGHFPMGLESPGGIGQHLLQIDLHSLGFDYLHTYCDQMRTVQLEQVRTAAASHLHPEKLVVLVVGPAALCQSDLEALGPVNLVGQFGD
ncbi:MAG: insulinase family protein [Deltaproteobacteria bacterium]|nr:insulinase family protein [Deltaproteobacteria bacterium]